MFELLFFIGKCFAGKCCAISNKNCDETVGTSFVDCVSGAFLAVDIVKFLSVGGYDERIFLYCEETTLGIKMKQAGYKTVLLMNERYVHRHAVSTNKSIPSAIKRRSILLDSRLFVLREYMKASKFEIFLTKCCYKIVLFEEMAKTILRKQNKNQTQTSNKYDVHVEKEQ